MTHPDCVSQVVGNSVRILCWVVPLLLQLGHRIVNSLFPCLHSTSVYWDFARFIPLKSLLQAVLTADVVKGFLHPSFDSWLITNLMIGRNYQIILFIVLSKTPMFDVVLCVFHIAKRPNVKFSLQHMNAQHRVSGAPDCVPVESFFCNI